MRSLVLALGVGAFTINPSVACGPAEPEYQYGDAELRAAIEGTWSLHITRSDHSFADLTLHLAQQTAPETASGKQTGSSLVRAAHACGTRTLIASAGACIDTTEMPLDVTLVEGDSALDAAALAGIFRVDSLVFSTGMLELALGELRIRAAVDADGNVTSSALIEPLGGTASLGHVPR